MLLEENIILGSDNIIALALRHEKKQITHIGSNLDQVDNSHIHPAIIRCKVVIKPIIDDPSDTEMVIDSAATASSFDFVSNPNVLVMQLGAHSIKNGRHIADIIVYETGLLNGLNWGQIMLTVK